MKENTPALKAFSRLFSLSPSKADEILGSGGHDYYQEFFSGQVPIETYIEKVKLILNLTGAHNKKILDIGCGHGFVVSLLAALGAKKASGVDISESKIKACQRLADFLGVTNIDFNCYQGKELPFDDGKHDSGFDAVTISAALSHVQDIDATLQEAYRILKPGGIIYVFEDNNALHYRYKEIMEPVWHFAETGEGAASIHGKTDPNWISYRERRYHMIKNWFPELEEKQAKKFALATKGLIREEIKTAIEEHLKTNTVIKCSKPFHYYAPDTGEAMEYPFTPPLLKEFISAHFQNAKIHSAWTPPYRGLKGGLKRILRVMGNIFPPLMYRTQPCYIVTASKPRNIPN